MRVRFGIGATNIPSESGAYATLSHNDHDFGRTETVFGLSEISWRKVLVLDCAGGVDDANVAVKLFSGNDDRLIGRAQFSISAIMGRRSKVVEQDLEGGGT
mmetsp:Transcript_57072/g.170101  ORF Transcript_57072/g.170101 Transcript_57072/m.170101 type:complete len:101 (-) Transcript_57072:118-420(-)